MLAIYFQSILVKDRERDGERVNKSSFKGCMVAIRDASYIFQSLLVKGNIIAYVSFVDKISHMKRVCAFNNPKYCFLILQHSAERH